MSKLSLAAMAAIFLTPLAVLADDSAEEFGKKKTEILSHIDEKIQKMQEHKSCVQSASDRDGLEKCHDSMKAWHKEERRDRKEARKEKLKGKLKKMEEKPEDKD